MKKTILGLVAVLALTGCFEYSNGSRAGTVTKFSQKGIFCKTWEGELNLGGMRNRSDGQGGSSVVANTFEFTVENPSLVPAIQKALDEGTPVVITYREELVSSPCRGSTNYYVSSVQEQKNTGEQNGDR